MYPTVPAVLFTKVPELAIPPEMRPLLVAEPLLINCPEVDPDTLFTNFPPLLMSPWTEPSFRKMPEVLASDPFQTP